VKRWLVGLAIAAAVIGFLYAATLRGAGVRCDACMRFEGREACKSASGASRDDAEYAAIMTACAVVSGGVTQTIACQATVPVSLHCSE
jgi:hypothetical protein